jgi:hypothetical protein
LAYDFETVAMKNYESARWTGHTEMLVMEAMQLRAGWFFVSAVLNVRDSALQ